MKTNYLFPHSCKKIGWIIFIPALIAGVLYLFNIEPTAVELRVFALFSQKGFAKMITTDFWNDSIIIILTISLLFIGFSREKDEDEYISRLRGESLVWATIAYSVFILLATCLVYDMSFLGVLFCAPFITLILFIIKFNIALYRFRKEANNEE